MFHRFSLFSFLVFVFHSVAFGQGIIKGRVTDKITGESLPGVYVIYGRGLGTTTDSRGTYFFTADTGKIEVSFHLIGFVTATKIILVNKGDTLTFDAALQTETHQIDQVVVSADRIEHKLSEMTVSVDVIKPDFLSSGHITDAQELITKTPGIEVLDGQASIRGGSGYSYGVGSRVMALVDGLPLISADAGSIRWQYLPVENLSQVEIIKGASSVLYGSSALNGIINFRTMDASNIPLTSVFSETGMYMKPANKSWVWWSSPRIFSTFSFSDLRKAGNTDLGLSLNLFTDGSYRKYNDERLGKIGIRLKHYVRKLPGLSYGINVNGGQTARTDFILWKNADNALVQDTSSVSFFHGKYLSADPYFSFSKTGMFRHDLRMRLQYSENMFPVKLRNNARTFSLYSEYQTWYRITELLNITAGTSGNWNKINSNFFGDHQGINLALFTQTEFRPFTRLKISAGIRAEENILDSRADKPVPVVRAGINWQAAKYTYVRASFGQGYRYPSVAEKYASTSLGSVTIFPNPAIEPESGWSSEAGVKQGISAGKITGQADLSVFYSQSRNIIEYVFGVYPKGLGFMASNVEFARIYGTEFEFFLNRAAGEASLTISGGYSFVYPVEFNPYTGKNSDIWLKYRRKHSAKITFSLLWKRIECNLSIYARSKILAIDNVFLSPATREQILPGFYSYWLSHNTGYVTMDLQAGYKLNRQLSLSVAMKNLTNTEYMGRPADIQPPRNVSIRLSGKF